MSSYDPPELPKGVNVLSSTSLPGSTGVSFAAPVSTRQKSHVQVGFAHLLEGRTAYDTARCLRDVLGLVEVDTASDVLGLELEALSAAIEREDAREARRQADIRATQRARTVAYETQLAELKSARKKHVKEALPARRGMAEKILAVMAEVDADGVFADARTAVEVEVEAVLRAIDADIRRAEQSHAEVAAYEAKPVPAEDFGAYNANGANPRHLVPECMKLLRALHSEKLAARAAHIARVRADLQLAGVM